MRTLLRRKKPQKSITATLSEAEATPATVMPAICPGVRTGGVDVDGDVAACELASGLALGDDGEPPRSCTDGKEDGGGGSHDVEESAAAVTIDSDAVSDGVRKAAPNAAASEVADEDDGEDSVSAVVTESTGALLADAAPKTLELVGVREDVAVRVAWVFGKAPLCLSHTR